MADLPSDPAASAAIRFLSARHRDYTKALDGLDERGLNWRPGTETNAIFEILTHALDEERRVITAISGTMVPPDHHFNVRGTPAQAAARIQQADADVAANLAGLNTADLGREVSPDGRPLTVVLALSVAFGHTAEHMGHIQLTRQLWDQYGKTGMLPGSEA